MMSEWRLPQNSVTEHDGQGNLSHTFLSDSRLWLVWLFTKVGALQGHQLHSLRLCLWGSLALSAQGLKMTLESRLMCCFQGAHFFVDEAAMADIRSLVAVIPD